MVWLHRRLPGPERYPLPPREITEGIEKKVSGKKLDPDVGRALTWLAHFGYGGAAGSLYAGAKSLLPVRGSLLGPLFGLGVWAVSYLGILPGLRLLTPATEHPLRRSWLMIVAHLVWGWFLAMIYEVLDGDLRRENAAFHQSSRPRADQA